MKGNISIVNFMPFLGNSIFFHKNTEADQISSYLEAPHFNNNALQNESTFEFVKVKLTLNIVKNFQIIYNTKQEFELTVIVKRDVLVKVVCIKYNRILI